MKSLTDPARRARAARLRGALIVAQHATEHVKRGLDYDLATSLHLHAERLIDGARDLFTTDELAHLRERPLA